MFSSRYCLFLSFLLQQICSFYIYSFLSLIYVTISSVQSLSRVRLFATPWTVPRQASLSITNSWSSPKLMSTESVMPSSHLILCHPLLFLLPIPPSIRVFYNESTLRMRWPKYWSFSFSINASKEHLGKRQRRTLHNDQKINPRRRYNNYKYICTQHRSTALCKANANKYERGN